MKRMEAERKMAGNRSTNMARLITVQSLYEMEIAGASFDDVLISHLENRWVGQLDEEGKIRTGARRLARTDRKKFAEIVRGVIRDRERLDGLVSGALPEGETIERLDLILRIVLRAGTYELYGYPKVPARVAISEYVDIAKAFYHDGEPTLVNGILDRIGRTLRPGEIKGTNTGV